MFPMVEKQMTAEYQIQVHDPNFYEDAAQIETGGRGIIFNGGHIGNEIKPYIEELIEKYGAEPKYVKKGAARGKEVLSEDDLVIHLLIDGESLGKWALDKLNSGEFTDTLLNIAHTLIGIIPLEFAEEIQRKLQELEGKRVDAEAISKMLFTLGQQLGQYTNIDDRYEMYKVLKAKGSPKAKGLIDGLEDSLNLMGKEMSGILLFLEYFQRGLESSKQNKRKFNENPEVGETLDYLKAVIEPVQNILSKLAIYQAQIELARQDD
jgi:hypothetical protein